LAHARIYNTQSILQRRHGLPPTQQHHSPSINHTLNPGAAPRLETNRTSTKRGTQQRAAARAQPLHALRPRSSLRSLSAYRQDSCLYRTRGACVRKTWLQKHMGPAHLWRPAVQELQGPARGGGRCVHPGARPRSPAIPQFSERTPWALPRPCKPTPRSVQEAMGPQPAHTARQVSQRAGLGEQQGEMRPRLRALWLSHLH